MRCRAKIQRFSFLVQHSLLSIHGPKINNMRTIIILKRLLALVLFLASAAVSAIAANAGVEDGGCDAENADGSCVATAAAPVVQSSEGLRLTEAVARYGEAQTVEVSAHRPMRYDSKHTGDFSSLYSRIVHDYS